jgi:multidrug efflux system membrane fusion protein
MKRSLIIAALLAVVAIGWIGSGFIDGQGQESAVRKPAADLSAEEAPASVRTRTLTATPHVSHLLIRGTTEASRDVQVKAEIRGRVVEVLAEKGDFVNADQPIVRLKADDREARLAQAKALLAQRKIEYEAAKTLSEKGYRAETQLAAAKAALDAAEAAVRSAQVNVDNLIVHAPFDGVLDTRDVEMGDFVDSGDVVGRVVDLQPVLGVAQVSERDIGNVATGQSGQLRLITGATFQGRVSFISKAADPATRTYRVELEVSNEDAAIPDGMTAEISLPMKTVMAHRISPAILTLSDEGVVGVKLVSEEDRVAFTPVRILEDAPGGTWISGPPPTARFIVVGQEFVADGDKVRPVPAEEADDTPAVTGRPLETGS